ncbi:MAG: ISAs1 family transposase [Firmicutes bacterium]|nr:ISAs1 family transposase [Bacillota bacterium]
MNNLIIYFNDLTDTRDTRGLKHELTNCIVMTIYGILAGHYDAENISFFLKINEDYFIKELNLENGTPSADTLLRIYSLIDPEEFMQIFVKWVESIIKEKNEQLNNKYKILPIDGKAIKSATDKINGANTPYIVSAFLYDLGISIAGVKVDDKSNEITAIPDLLDLINIENCIITIDAMGCQKNIAEKIVAKGGHYCFAVKENKKNFYLDIKDYFDSMIDDNLNNQNIITYTTIDKDHGRIERREHYILYDIDWLYGKENWKNINMIGMTRNYREINGEVSIKEKYYISDLKFSGEEFAKVVRNHWSIENNLHWVLDVHFREDWSLCKEENALKNLSTIRKICYNLTKLDPFNTKLSFKKKLTLYNHDLNHVKKLVFNVIPS